MEYKETMGKRISDLRKRKGMTQEQLAQQVGVTAQAVSKWENDLSCPDISILAQLAEALGVTTDELLGKVQLRSLAVEDTEKQEKRKHTVNVRLNMNTWEKVIFSLLVMGLGIVFLLNALRVIQLGSGITFWSVLWPFCLIFMGVMLCKSDLSPVSLGIALFGLYMLLYNAGIIPAQYKLTWSMIWPAALILIGLTVLLGYLFPKRKENGEGFFHVEKGDPVFSRAQLSSSAAWVRHSSSRSFSCRCKATSGFSRSSPKPEQGTSRSTASKQGAPSWGAWEASFASHFACTWSRAKVRSISSTRWGWSSQQVRSMWPSVKDQR